MPGRRGLTIEEQREGSKFRFEEGRGQIADIKVRRGSASFSVDKCCLVISLQRIGRDGRPTDDAVVEEELNYGPLTKFHPGMAQDSRDDSPRDLGADGEGNTVYVVESDFPDPKAKAAIWGKSLQNAGVAPLVLNGFMPNLTGLDAYWVRDVVKYDGLKKEDGSEASGSNLVVKKGDGNILNLSEINRRAGGPGAGSGVRSATSPAIAGTTLPAGASASAGSGAGAGIGAGTSVSAGTGAGTSAGTGAGPGSGAASLEDEVVLKSIELIPAFSGKTPAKLLFKDLGRRVMPLIAKQRVPASLHNGIQAKFKDRAWVQETGESYGWTFNGEEVTIPSSE
jgi:hypothetical protein